MILRNPCQMHFLQCLYVMSITYLTFMGGCTECEYSIASIVSKMVLLLGNGFHSSSWFPCSFLKVSRIVVIQHSRNHLNSLLLSRRGLVSSDTILLPCSDDEHDGRFKADWLLAAMGAKRYSDAEDDCS